MQRARFTVILVVAVLLTVSLFLLLRRPQVTFSTAPMLSDPFLQLPSETSANVVWFTDFAGTEHFVTYSNQLERQVKATTTKLTRLREDARSQVAPPYPQIAMREVWRHEAVVSGLMPNKRVSYRTTSMREERGKREEINSGVFTLAPSPKSGTPLKILLTSDHQLKPMTAANLQKVAQTVEHVDAVFIAGDLVNIPDRASEWFDDSRGGAFFPCLQGRAHYRLEHNGTETVYTGGELIQHAPLFTAIGNHEVMGRFSMQQSLNEQFNGAFPRREALSFYKKQKEQLNPKADPLVEQAWLKANSFNSDTYEEIFTLPQSIPGGKKYYAVTFGDVRLVVLYVTNIWRSPKLDPQMRGRYQERQEDLNQPENWGYGQHIFEPIAKGSLQYRWLEQELKSEEFQQAKYRVVMFHHPPHTLGENIVPPYTDPVAQVSYGADRNILSVRYEYPQDKDYIIHDLVPLLEAAGVQLVFYGHSHLWNRFSDRGLHFLESSNVGNSYGAFIGDKQRAIPMEEKGVTYAATGDPNGLEPIVPSIAPLKDETGQPLPYIASNDITAFSILDTGEGTVTSYYFDTRQPESEVVRFDQFDLDERRYLQNH